MLLVCSEGYSSVKMRLVTSDGLFKAETECSPKGYYFMPIYDQVGRPALPAAVCTLPHFVLV